MTGAVFVLVSLLVVIIAGSGLIQIHTRILDKILPVDQLSSPDDDSSDEEDSTYSTVRQFRVRYTCNYLNNDGQQFHRYQQNEQITSHKMKKTTFYIWC